MEIGSVVWSKSGGKKIIISPRRDWTVPCLLYFILAFFNLPSPFFLLHLPLTLFLISFLFVPVNRDILNIMYALDYSPFFLLKGKRKKKGLTDFQEFNTTVLRDLLGPIRGNRKIQHSSQCCWKVMGGLVCVDAKWCPGHRYHVLRDAWSGLLRSLAAVDLYRYLGLI